MNINTSKQQKRKILLVEDHPIAQKIAQFVLNALNCEIEIAQNATTALEKFLNNVYDLIFLDVGLPDKDGYTTFCY